MFFIARIFAWLFSPAPFLFRGHYGVEHKKLSRSTYLSMHAKKTRRGVFQKLLMCDADVRRRTATSSRFVLTDLDIYIILYVPKSKAIGVGRFLGQSNVWLREPPMAMVQKGIPYWNPQAPAPPRHLDEIDDSIQQGSAFGGAGPAKNSTFTRTVEETAG